MKREEIQIDDGLVCLSINGRSETVFNPTDFGFVEKIFNVFEKLDVRQQELEKRIKESEPREIFQIARDADAGMRELVDSVMGEGTCAAQFGEMNVYAYADGLPVWCNLLFAVLDRCESEMVAQQEQTNPRLQKYSAKYARRKK